MVARELAPAEADRLTVDVNILFLCKCSGEDVFAVVASSNNAAVNEAAAVSARRAQQSILFWRGKQGSNRKKQVNI